MENLKGFCRFNSTEGGNIFIKKSEIVAIEDAINHHDDDELKFDGPASAVITDKKVFFVKGNAYDNALNNY